MSVSIKEFARDNLLCPRQYYTFTYVENGEVVFVIPRGKIKYYTITAFEHAAAEINVIKFKICCGKRNLPPICQLSLFISRDFEKLYSYVLHKSASYEYNSQFWMNAIHKNSIKTKNARILDGLNHWGANFFCGGGSRAAVAAAEIDFFIEPAGLVQSVMRGFKNGAAAAAEEDEDND